MIGGYETRKAGVCPFEGVKTRRFLNAPVSLDFKHSIGAINAGIVRLRDNIHVTRVDVPDQRIDRYFVGVNMPRLAMTTKCFILDVSQFIVADKHADAMINAQLNDLADVAAKEAKIPVFANLMRWYEGNRLHYFACNHERFMLDSVNQNT